MKKRERKMKTTSIKKNFIMNILLTMSSFVFPLITFPYVSRILLPIGTGKVSFATSIITYFSMFAQLGIPTYGVKACAKVRDNKKELSRTVQEIMIINIAMCLIVYVVFVISLFVVPKIKQDYKLFLIISPLIIFNAIGVEWLYKGLEKYSYITKISIAFKFIAVILMFLLVHNKSDYIIYGGITIFASSESSILNLINLKKYVTLRPIGNYNFKKHIKIIIIYFGMSVATVIYTNLDIVMLGFLKTDSDVGFYNAAVRIKSILVSVVTSLGAVLLPRASYYIQQKKVKEFYYISKKSLNFILIAAVPLIAYFITYAKEGILFLSGDEYIGSIIPMQIIMPTILFIGLSNVIGLQMMVPLGKEKQVLYSEIAGAITDFLLNLVLIPLYSASGAAIGTLAAEFVVVIWQYSILKDNLKEIMCKFNYTVIILATFFAEFFSIWVKWLNVSYFVKLVISSICFFGVYVVILILGKETMINELKYQIVDKIKKVRLKG